jgi:hypothetical protein
MAPLRREWEALKTTLQGDLDQHDAQPDRKKRDLLSVPIKLGVEGFRQRLSKIRVLDPACGSGNFLYVALQRLLDLEDEIVRFCALHDIYVDPVPRIRPPQMHGIEINPYAAELAQVVIWIGYLQWLHEHNIDDPRRPILDKLQCIENRDAILDLSDKNNPAPATWPEADFIVGNPPFLGAKLFQSNGLGGDYTKALRTAYDLPRTTDLCGYWFERSREAISKAPDARVGLLATQAIRGEGSREVLARITRDGSIFEAWSDHPWTLDGAAVNVSIVCFDTGKDTNRRLDERLVKQIHSDLTSELPLITAKRLKENSGLAFRGIEKGGSFDIEWAQARELFGAPNASGRSNTDVLRPYLNGIDIIRRSRSMWLIDFADDSDQMAAAAYESPFAYVEAHVRPERKLNAYAHLAKRFWLLRRAVRELREAIGANLRFCACANTFKHWAALFVSRDALTDSSTTAFARSDEYFLGILNSSIHYMWLLKQGTQLEDRPRYTPTTCFETFPLPWPPGKEDVKHPAYKRISEAAKELNNLRERWLNPPEWIDLIAQQIDERDKFEDVPKEARPLIRQSAIMAAAAKDSRLKKRTLTNLYNERPTWLKLAHQKLDQAVLAAYAATDPAGGWDEAWADVWVETGAGQPLVADHPDRQKRVKVDQQVLGALLALNHRRAGKEAAG